MASAANKLRIGVAMSAGESPAGENCSRRVGSKAAAGTGDGCDDPRGCYPTGHAGQSPRGRNAAEAAAHDHDMRQARVVERRVTVDPP